MGVAGQPGLIDPTLLPAVLQAPTVFQSPAYLAAYRRHFGAGKNFHRLYVRDAEGGIGRAFLMSRGNLARRLEWWGAGIHDIGGVHIDSPPTAKLMWAEIQRLADSCDGANLAQIEACSPLIPLAAEAGWHTKSAETCPILALPPTWLEYVSSLGKNMREQIKRYPKRLEKEFAVEYRLASTETEVDSALTDLFVLHGKRWRARGQTGVLALPKRQRFHRELCRALLKRDGLRLWSLHCDGRPACVLLSYKYGDRYSFFIGGFEPELMRWSVGTCLFSRVFQTAIEEGATEFDFLKGREEYKYRFGAVDREYVTLSHYADSVRGRMLRRRVGAEEAFMAWVHKKYGGGGE